MATKVMSTQFAENTLKNAIDNGQFDPQTGTDGAMVGLIDDAFQKEKSKVGLGGFAQLGARYEPFSIPVATYLDLKYHLLFFNPELTGGPDFTLELGAALTF